MSFPHFPGKAAWQAVSRGTPGRGTKMKISFTVYGKPEPQGSTRAFIPKGWNRAVITSDNAELKPWRQQITRTAIEEFPKQNGGRCDPIARDVPVFVRMDFYLKRPAS